MVRYLQSRLYAGLIGLAVLLVVLQGCSNNKNSTSSQSGNGSALLLMHDDPIDSLRSVWLTVDSAQFLGSGNATVGTTGEIVFASPIRMDFMTLDSLSRIVAKGEVPAGSYTKIRLHVTNPEFVLSNGSTVDSSQIKLVANGHVDLNPQGQLIVVADSTTVVSLDLDLRHSIQVNQTGNDRFILNPQILVDATGGTAVRVVVDGTLTSVNSSSGQLQVQGTGSQVSTAVLTTGQTQILGSGGLIVSLGTLSVGSQVEIRGTLNEQTGVLTATQIKVTG